MECMMGAIKLLNFFSPHLGVSVRDIPQHHCGLGSVFLGMMREVNVLGDAYGMVRLEAFL